ncbi:MAG: DNA-binding protein [Mycoplasmataceae bacterium]|jgi:predicted DNA-binding protein with PD1-like motif|nr:DNA-binding protein [Mycoplasmataceae bacterium]
MQYTKINSKTFVIRLDQGDEILNSLTRVCTEQNIHCGSFHGLGAVNYVKIGLMDLKTKKYISKKMTGPMEIVNLVGNISVKDSAVYLHAHIAICDKSMQVFGGHLNEGMISLTGEIFVTKFKGDMQRKFDDQIGLNILDFE